MPKPLVRTRWIVAAAIATLAVFITALSGSPADTRPRPPSVEPRRLVIAVDGLSWEAFALAQQRGYFKRFRHAGRHVATYPSMSHPSWNEIVGTRRVFGARGNVRTIEARWFDLDAMRVADDPRQVVARQLSPYGYQRAWDYFFDPLIEPLQYLPGRKLFDRELAEAERAILDQFKGPHYVAYIGGMDAMAHTHRDELWPYVERFDAMIGRVADSLAARGTPADMWLVSDHGNAGGFVEGARERDLTTVSLDAAIRRAGLVPSDTGRLERSNQISVVTMALATMVNVYFADLARRRAFATTVIAERGVDLVTWLEVGDTDRYVAIVSRDGEARLRWRDSSYSYELTRGNPLGISDSLASVAGTRRWIPDSVLRAATAWGPYPDGPFRLAQSARKQVENAPDLIVNLRDGFAHRGDLGRFVRMVRTHGSLGARASLGVLASTSRPVPTHVRGQEVLDLIGLEPEQVLAHSATLFPHDPLALAETLSTGDPRVATGKDDDSFDMRFRRRARPIALSMDYFSLDAMRALLRAARSETRSTRIAGTRQALRRVDAVTGIARNVDTLLALADSLDARQLSRHVRQAESRVRGIPELAALADLRGIWSPDSAQRGSGESLRRGAMALWTLPYFLDAALTAQEWDSIPDSRDADFAAQWHGGLRERVASDPERLLDDSTLAPRVFAQVYAERKLLRSVEPASVPLLYDPDVSGTTVVYIPGIYDELFDHEIWARGMRSVRDRLGARTVTIPVDGRCGASINARTIVAALRDDTRRRLERGYDLPRYLIIGYSKGGIDATEALALAPDLARSRVSALVSIATPHRGTSVAERSDVPGAFMRWSVAKPRPAACDSASASESLWPATRSAFWVSQDDGRALSQLTRYFSLSFVADAGQSHPWMKVTKQIGQFREPNDGVVALSSSRFPHAVNATDLGVIQADHIAGRVASSFPQDAFLEAVVLTVAELGALRPGGGDRWRTMIAARETSVWRGLRRRYFGDDRERTRVPAFVTSLRTPSALPGGNTGWSPQRAFRMAGAENLADVPVRAMVPDEHPNGIHLRCDQRNMEAFRREYEFYYDAGNGGSEDDPANGASIVVSPGSSQGRACRVATVASVIKMTTVAFRFRPLDYPSLRLQVWVDQSLSGADVGKAAFGRNDAAFKLWLILRDTRPAAAGRTVLFGYTWAGADTRGHVPPSGSLIEARSSRRNMIVSTLPEAWLIAIGGPAAEDAWKTIERDLAQDLVRAYPQIPLGALQVVGITMQSDSDDTGGKTEVFLRSLEIGRRPSNQVALGKR